MPTTPTYPGVYIEEIPSGVRTISPVATAITAFVGRASRGPTNLPITVFSFGEFDRKFGGLDVKSTMTYAVRQYFLNGGSEAIIVRVAAENASKAQIALGGLTLEASGEGAWGNQIRARVDYNTKDSEDVSIFNLSLFEPESQTLETYFNLSTDPETGRFVSDVLLEESVLVRVAAGETVPTERPPANAAENELRGEWFDPDNEGTGFLVATTQGQDGGDLTSAVILGQASEKTGMYALEKADLFNMLVLPAPQRASSEHPVETWASALQYCAERRAMLFVDPPLSWTTVDAAVSQLENFRGQLGSEDRTRNSVMFFPRLKMADEKKDGRSAEFSPSGAIAGVFARTDLLRGVWKAPAGINAGLVGVRELMVNMTDRENGRLNPIGLNCVRSFPAYKNVVWGSRTLAGADRLASEWKYIAVRRLALFLQESLYRGTQWVVFEPNDQPLWDQIRINIDTFMNNLFRQGAFQGTTPKDAYFVNCGSETTTQNDIDRGIVNIEIGFAPLKPAEFVILKFQQIARQNS